MRRWGNPSLKAQGLNWCGHETFFLPHPKPETFAKAKVRELSMELHKHRERQKLLERHISTIFFGKFSSSGFGHLGAEELKEI